jgi:hypothetical protein
MAIQSTKNKNNASSDYKDIVDALIKEGIVKHISAKVVYDIEVQNSKFKYSISGNVQTLVHEVEPIIKPDNKVIAAYSTITFPDGSYDINFMRDIELKECFEYATDKESWKPRMNEFYKKTVIRNHFKLLEKSEKIQNILRQFDSEHDLDLPKKNKNNKDVEQTENALKELKEELKVEKKEGRK